jgi:hypothetical protein
LSSDAEDQTLLLHVVDYYHETLKNDAEGLPYLEKRGLSREALEHFKLGLANRTLGYRLPEKTRKAGAEIRDRLQALGILRQSGHVNVNGVRSCNHAFAPNNGQRGKGDAHKIITQIERAEGPFVLWLMEW